ncbi:MAG: chemotaxis protein CheW [Alphaproteobacteria bacterium]|nr:chemotaxis protein CheW [Alphaproteobacteria bacterium]
MAKTSANTPARIDEDGKGEDGVANLQFITFRVGKEEYGVDIMAVREIKGWVPATRLPNSPHFVRGVINLRGIMVPIYDLRARFGGGETEITRTHVVIIVKVGERMFGVLVDGVSDILTITEDQIKPAPEMDSTVDSAYLRGLITIKERMVALLVLEKLFTSNDVDEAKLIAESAA